MIMKKLVLSLAIISTGFIANAQEEDTTKVSKQKGEPLEGMDMTWLNGGDRRSTPTLAGKYFTPTVMVDANYTHSFANPIDNTVVGSTTLARNNEMQVSGVYLGGDFTYKQARAHANSASLFKPWHRAEGHASGTVLQRCVRGDHAWHEVRVTTTTRDPFGVAACSGYA